MEEKNGIFIEGSYMEILEKLDRDWEDFFENRQDLMYAIFNVFETFYCMRSAKLPVDISNEDIDNVKKEYAEIFRKYFFEDNKKGIPPVMIALLIDSFNTLSHEHKKNGGALYTECMVGKDFLINKLAQLCLSKKGFDLGFRCGLNEDKKKTYYDKIEKKYFYIPTFEVDIPGVGHLAWHLGNRQRVAELRKYVADIVLKMKLVTLNEEDKKKFKDRAGLDEEFFRYPDEMMRILYPIKKKTITKRRDTRGEKKVYTLKEERVKRRNYSNLDLLKGEKTEKYNEVDKALRESRAVGDRKKRLEEFYGIKNLEKRVKKIEQSH